MDLRKYLMIGGIGVIVLIAFLILKSIFFKDVIKPDLGQLITQNRKMIQLSSEAQGNLDSFELQVTAANTAAVITSDNLTFNKYYRDNYGKKLPADKDKASNPVKKLSESANGAAYSETYRRLLTELRDNNLKLAKALLTNSDSDELNELLNSYNQHLATLYEKL